MCQSYLKYGWAPPSWRHISRDVIRSIQPRSGRVKRVHSGCSEAWKEVEEGNNYFICLFIFYIICYEIKCGTDCEKKIKAYTFWLKVYLALTKWTWGV